MPTLAAAEELLQRRSRRLGAHYTPHPIVGRMVRAVLEPLCRGRTPEAILGLRILDPAVGSGRFLVAALGHLAEATGRPEAFRAPIAASCLYGIDVSPEAATLARRALADASGCDPAALKRHVAVADSLLADVAATLGIPAFDVILTNPPWLSFSGRQAAALSPSRRRALAERFAGFRRWPTTHGAFLELAARLLAPGGRAALVVPLQVCHLPGYEAVRRAVLETCRFEPPPDPIGENAFPGVVQPAAIVYLREAASISGDTSPVAQASCLCGSQAGSLCHQPRATGLAGKPIRNVEAAVLRRMERHPPAPPRTFRDPGVHTGNSARLILRDEPAPGCAPVREGRCVRPFALEPPRRWLAVEPQLPSGHYWRIRPLAVYTAARILLRQTADRPVAARHAAPAYFRNSVLACCGVAGLDEAVLLGLLNSTLLAFYHRCCHADSRQRAFPQVKVAHLQALPIARDAGELRPCVLRIEELAAEGLGSPGEPLGKELQAECRRLNRLVYGIYGLAQAEVRYVESTMASPGS